mgnify:CR=1 FL=1
MSKQIGDDIRALRKGRELTLKDVSAAIGRSVGWLSQIERGQTVPSVRDLGLLAEYFGINISFFFRSASRREEERGAEQVVGAFDEEEADGGDGPGVVEGAAFFGVAEVVAGMAARAFSLKRARK